MKNAEELLRSSSWGKTLTDEEMTAMAGIDKKCRLIKGQVFLWPTAKDWNDLWDESGMIAGA